VFEIKDEGRLPHIILESRWKRFAWRIPEAGLGSGSFGRSVNENDIG
jgi:hypothetical protein